jgi:two-component system sensor kinase FixL
LGIGLRRKPRAAHLLFSLNAFAVAVFSCLELAVMRADSPAEYLALLRWADFAVAALLVSLTAFVWVFFGTGRKWLAFLAAGLTSFAMTADLSPEPRMIYLQLTSIRKMEAFGGATYTLAEGVPSPWNAVFYLSVLLLLAFVADASVTLWRRGARRRAIVVGGTITFFLLAAGGHSALVESRTLRSPYLISFAYLAILVAMGIELSDDVLNAAQLARDLRESENRMTLATEAANLSIWVRDLTRKKFGPPTVGALCSAFEGGIALPRRLFSPAPLRRPRNGLPGAGESDCRRWPLPDGISSGSSWRTDASD